MPTGIDVCLGCLIELEVHKQLETIRNGNDIAASVAREIACIGSASIFLEDGGRRDPDKLFAYKNSIYPGLVIEMA